MNKLLRLKIFRNKNNGQISLALPKRKLNNSVKKMIEDQDMKYLKMKLEGFEE